MTLHLPTMLMALVSATSVLGASVLFVALHMRWQASLLWWGGGLMANAASYAAFALRYGGQAELSILLTNLLAGLTLPMHTVALQGLPHAGPRRLPAPLVWGTVPLMGLAALVWLQDDLTRNVALGLLLTLQATLFAWQSWDTDADGQRVTGRWLLIAGAVTLVLVLALRTAFMLRHGSGAPDLRVPAEVQAMSYLVVLMALLTSTIGFVLIVLMQMERALDRLHDAATHDALTGAANRRELMDRFACALSMAQRGQQPLAVLMIDIDHFKRVNDTYGHPTGDSVLRGVARRIQARLRRHDLLARYGGEEFVVLLPDTDRDAARAVAEAVRAAVQASPLIVGRLSIPVTISVGVHSRTPGAQATDGVAEQMLDASDRAVYRAKAAGRNRVEDER